ncbi:MAG: hypothetical protein C0392_13805, partial [Syntrophus sp. (in: bacteria)]|nr:hypothetical protein [Syntrophus sp. (in: bacteria)]
FCVDKPPALYYLYKYNMDEDFHHSITLYSGQFHRAVKKGNKDMLVLLEEGFAKITREEYDAINRKWMGAPLPINPDYIRYIGYVIISSCVLGLMLLIWNYALRKKVSHKTMEAQSTVKALRESEKKYRELVESVNSIILRMDTSGTVTFMNEFGQNFFDYKEKEIVGKSVLGTIVPEVESTGRDLKELILDMASEPDRYMNNINENMRRNGDRVWIAWTNKPVFDSHNRIKEILCIGNDITQRKEAEEERRHLKTQLLQSQKMEAIGTLAGGIAHDFNNILTTIIGFSSLLQMDLDKEDPKRIYIEQVLTASEKAANLTQGLLAFSRKQVVELKPRKVKELIRGIEKLLKRLLTEDVEFDIILDGPDVVIMTDISLMDQVLMNLATNARDAMPKGGKLIIEAKAIHVNNEFIKARGFGELGDYALISVIDTGMGMDEKTRETIFEPFFTTKEVGKGTGLGLSIVYGIVKQHNGYIDVVSEPYRGTTFNIYLPAVKMAADERKDSPRDIKGGKETILVAEDNAQLRGLVTEVLGRKGYRVIEAADGEDAILKFMKQKNEIALVILDVVMPRMNGKEVYEELRKARPDIKVLFTSVYTGDVVFDKGIHDEAVDFISKPLLPDDLLLKVRAVLEK